MRRSAVPEGIFLTLIIAASIYVLLLSQNFSLRAFLLPSIGAVVAGLLSTYELAKLVRHGKTEAVATNYSAHFAVAASEAQSVGEIPAGRTFDPSEDSGEQRLRDYRWTESGVPATSEVLAPGWKSFLWLLVMTASVFLLGLAYGGLVFTVLYMRVRAKDDFRRIALAVLPLGALLYVLVAFLDARLYGGVLF